MQQMDLDIATRMARDAYRAGRRRGYIEMLFPLFIALLIGIAIGAWLP